MNFSAVWKILFGGLGIAFAVFVVTAMINNFGASNIELTTFISMSRAESFAFFIFLFFCQAIVLAFLAWLIISGLSKAGAYFWMQRHSEGEPQTPKLFSVVTASLTVAIFFSSALRAVAEAMVGVSVYLFGTLPQTILSEVDRIIQCVARETDIANMTERGPEIEGAPIRNCIGELVNADQLTINNAVYSLTGAEGFTISQLPYILMAFVVFAAVLRIVDAQAQTATTVMKFWTAYSVIAALAIYLSLSATLSVSLLLEKNEQTSDSNSDALVAQITNSYPDKPSYDFGELEDLQPLDIVDDRTRIAIWVNSQQVDATTARDQITDMLNDMENRFASITSQARTRYGVVEREDFNSREQALYYQDLLLWSQASFTKYLDQIHLCNRAYRSKLNAFRLGGAVHASKAVSGNGSTQAAVVAEQLELFDRESRRANLLLDECLNTTPQITPPAQRQLGSSLGPIGQATGWLLRAQSLPLTLVVGLVGYGLLGALISRFVIARDDGFRIDSAIEFAVVALAGFVAALVVFVSSFGGMYVLAREATEPNPYAVFALCLGGAIFSSSVWTNLRDRLGDAAQHTEELREQEIRNG